MCFSAGASFAAGGVISAVGVAAIAQARKPSVRVFASIPLIFGIQQFAEGIIWISLQNQDHLAARNISSFIYLSIADILWPWMISFSMLLMENNPRKRKLLKALLIGGLALSAYHSYFHIFFKITPEILNCHIYYDTASLVPLELPAFLLYLIVTIVPLFISSIPLMKVFGILIFISVVVTVIFYTRNTTSVWCFFAAILSIVIYLIVKQTNDEKETDGPFAGLQGQPSDSFRK